MVQIANQETPVLATQDGDAPGVSGSSMISAHAVIIDRTGGGYLLTTGSHHREFLPGIGAGPQFGAH
jgi:hypothetical protein